jgi:hypothetical protein
MRSRLREQQQQNVARISEELGIHVPPLVLEKDRRIQGVLLQFIREEALG